ncbi:hypothetical protein [Sansalvadorimonas verongulae]|uniref:hypothetical protein n=1 Tax=Sansalvadorimonas verongulae TaxID=2172824 RepID=UPI0012BD5B3C|nr:hypothetical protein [Sansalvadorimonas verongulae]MTI12109.1 hypothetical protein [Sansalvadorimonas verongulae]
MRTIEVNEEELTKFWSAMALEALEAYGACCTQKDFDLLVGRAVKCHLAGGDIPHLLDCIVYASELFHVEE